MKLEMFKLQKLLSLMDKKYLLKKLKDLLKKENKDLKINKIKENSKEVMLKIVESVAVLKNKKGVILDEQFIFNTCKFKKKYANIWVF